MSVATVTNQGRAFMAAAIKAQALHVAWGSGDPAWDDMADGDLPSLLASTGLVNELGRRVVTMAGYVTPDEENGNVTVPIGSDGVGGVLYQRYSLVEDPTPYLYVRCNFDNADAQNSTIREMALMGGTVTAEDLPLGQQYFVPEEITDTGFCIAVEIIRPCFERSPSVRESYEFVLPI